MLAANALHILNFQEVRQGNFVVYLNMSCRVLHCYVNSRIANFTANISWVFVWSFCFSADQSWWNFLTVPPNPFLRLQTVSSWDVPVAELSCNCIASYFPTTIEVRLWIDFSRLNDPSISSSFEVVILLLLEVMELDPCRQDSLGCWRKQSYKFCKYWNGTFGLAKDSLTLLQHQ